MRCFFGSFAFGGDERVDDVVLPRRCFRRTRAGEVRFVANFVVNIVEAVQLGERFAEQRVLPRHDAGVGQCVVAMPGNVADAIDVVLCVERMQHPTALNRPLVVEDIERVELDDDSPVAGGLDEILQAAKVIVVPAVEIEFVATEIVTRLVAARPRREIASVARRERVLVTAAPEHGIGRFKKIAVDRARQVQASGLKRVQVSDVVEIRIQHRAIMLGRSDEHGRPAAKQEVVRIFRMQRDWLSSRLLRGELCGLFGSRYVETCADREG